MIVNVKNRIWLGTVFLFVMLCLTGGVCIYYLVRISNDSKGILRENYESLEYCHGMHKQLDSLTVNYPASIKKFENDLELQEHNITEPGERQSTSALRKLFSNLKNKYSDAENIKAIDLQLENIIQLNMNAIHKKKQEANNTTDHAFAYISVVATLVLMIAFIFLLNFPAVVTGPIMQLTDGITEIANGNYTHRVAIFTRNEFGQLATAFNKMAERLEYFEGRNLSKLLFEKSRAEAVINSLKDPSIGIDKSNIILFANYQILNLLNLNVQDVVGKTVDEVRAKSNLFAYLVQNESSLPIKVQAGTKNIYFLKEVIDVSQDGNNSKVIVLKNITSFKELDAAKTHFIATISHELKTPIASSDFSLSLLEDVRTGNLSVEQMKLVENVKEDNGRMLKILSELLDMSQVEAGSMRLNIQDVHPIMIVDATMEAVRRNAAEKQIAIQLDIDDSLGLIKADAEKTSWVLNNFLTNAIKYSPRGGLIVIGVTQQGRDIIFSVTDRGPGIESHHLQHVFERYYKVPGSTGGTGLGLAICKDFMEMQQGKIWAESVVGKGCSFRFSFNNRYFQA
ncbi:MAG: ATP-binding protein [Chitinophagaceae bacterium]